VNDERAAARDDAAAEDVTEIRGDIEQIRGEMGGMLHELGDRLDPNVLVQRAKENVRDATIGRVEDTAKGVSDMVMETIRRNPIPAALAGAGLAMLWMNRATQDGGSVDRYGLPSSTAGDIGTQARSTAAGVAAGVGDTAGQIGETISQTTSQVGDSIGTASRQVGETIGQTAEQVSWNFEQMMEANPLGLGLVALGAGAVIGALVPATPQEREALGDASRQIGTAVRDTVDQATQKAQEQLDRAEGSVAASRTT
jgi:hypothetical protein